MLSNSFMIQRLEFFNWIWRNVFKVLVWFFLRGALPAKHIFSLWSMVLKKKNRVQILYMCDAMPLLLKINIWPKKKEEIKMCKLTIKMLECVWAIRQLWIQFTNLNVGFNTCVTSFLSTIFMDILWKWLLWRFPSLCIMNESRREYSVVGLLLFFLISNILFHRYKSQQNNAWMNKQWDRYARRSSFWFNQFATVLNENWLLSYGNRYVTQWFIDLL